MALLDLYKVQLIETAILIVVYFVAGYIFNTTANKVGLKFGYQKSRIKLLKKFLRGLVTVVCLLLLLLIWGVNQSRLFFFLSSFLTILGIAFVAQWSILSNITSTVIIFFNHPVRIGDSISIAEKDNQVEGVISDVGIFFITIKTKDNELITMPSNLFIQKAIKRHRTN